ncbi:MAG: hypothetical protein OZSIB_1100 [Candidatus Ozemobacter sibiricus]|uniref:Uncharacterized protein n=1 Tax=Candidatus Ozemobacter sibiricus TaxID=2268124 RepID=A0A367ZLM7_9BACT|nr:MAG: hypothetical protein OZSIB_1100 [Candidatus Ozemobacter sibiricus]
MTTDMDAQRRLAEIDRLRDEIRAIEDEVAARAGQAESRGASPEELRQIGARGRQATELRARLEKWCQELRRDHPEIFAAWAERHQAAVRRLIMAELARHRPGVASVEEGLARITAEGAYSSDDLKVLQLAGFLDEWREVLEGKRPYALFPPTWETYPPVPALDCDLREPLPVPADLAARHPDILAVREWQAWHAGLVFLAEALSILDQGKPCRLERATGAYTPGQPWESALTLTTGQLSITLRWGEEPSGSAATDAPASATDAPAGPGPAGTRPFCRVTTSGFLPHEQLLWSGSFGGESSGLTISFRHFREDAIEAIQTLAGRLFAKATLTTTTPASPTTG